MPVPLWFPCTPKEVLSFPSWFISSASGGNITAYKTYRQAAEKL
jgi:hypothetical protein